MTNKAPTRHDTKEHAKVVHPSMKGDGTEEQNLGERGNPTARVNKKEVAAAFSKQHPANSMTNSRGGQVDAATTIASAHNRSGADTAKRWFVPPIVVPAFLMILIVARAFYSAFL
jgi:hypothetical protein